METGGDTGGDRGTNRPLPLPLAASFVTATLYGGGLELYQTTLPMRAGTWGDAGINAMGAAAALAALTALRHWQDPAAGR